MTIHASACSHMGSFKMSKEPEQVTISREEYDSLIQSSRWLECLESAGVDNWSGFDYARELLDEWDEEG